MNRGHILSIGFCLIAISAVAQKFELNIHGKNLSDFIKLEKALGSEKYESKTNYMSLKGLAQPLIYRHKEDSLPVLLCYYFYFQKDSTIDYVSYEWDETNFKEHGEFDPKTPKEIKAYRDKYEEIYNQIFSAYGASKNISRPDDAADKSKGDFE